MSEAIKNAIEAMEFAQHAVGPFHRVATKKLRESIAELKAIPQAQAGQPIAAVHGWFHGECVIRPLDPEAVLPAGMALYSQPQAQAGEGEAAPPCDCIEKVGGFFVSNCYCRNIGDARDAQTYCVENNTAPPATKVNQQLLEALVAVRSCMAIGIPEFSLHDREVMIQADNAIDAAIAAAQGIGK